MTRNYTESIPVELTKKLYKAGMPIETSADDEWWCPPYAEVFDWLIEKGIYIDVYACYMYLEFGVEHWVYGGDVASKGTNCSTEEFRSWEEAAVSAIDMALEITEEKQK